MHSKAYVSLALMAGVVGAELLPRQQPSTTPTPTSAGEVVKVTAISGCHLHGYDLFCSAGKTEYHVHSTPTATTDLPASFTDCHSHGSEMFCVGPDGQDVEVEAVAATAETGDEHDHEHEHEGHDHEEGASSRGRNCHFHAGVEHCEDEEVSCDVPSRDYKVGLRVGLLFVILATSALGVFGPIFLQRILPQKLNLLFIVLKQFGTGVIISTAFVHLYTHASLMFTNKCLGPLAYESTTSAILIAGLFLSFCVEYAGQRIVLRRIRSAERLPTFEDRARATLATEVVGVLVMEAGILFHSLLIGLTLVVAGDSFFLTLFVVILFHQIFEGLALGTRIATIGTHIPTPAPSTTSHETEKSPSSTPTHSHSLDPHPTPTFSLKKKLALAALFAFITPIGMAIGIGVLQHFNGNDKSTLVAIGTLDALSAGILVWVGVVEMWAGDWMVGSHGRKAELAEADGKTVVLAGLGLVSGLVVMSLLGKWA